MKISNFNHAKKLINKLFRGRPLIIAITTIGIGLIYSNIDSVNATTKNKSENKILSGHFTVTDGDTLRLGDVRIRLYGIDAPEKKQKCKNNLNKSYNCGIESTKYLASLITSSTHCVVKNNDRYGRKVATCFNGAQDINQELVRQGWAVAYTAYTKKYVVDEKYAKDNKLGIWNGVFETPSDYRKKPKK